MRTNPPPGKKLVRDWIGLRVRFLIQIGNGLGQLPAGTLATVKRAGGTGIELHTDPCKCCGMQLKITRVSDRHITPIKE